MYINIKQCSLSSLSKSHSSDTSCKFETSFGWLVDWLIKFDWIVTNLKSKPKNIQGAPLHSALSSCCCCCCCFWCSRGMLSLSLSLWFLLSKCCIYKLASSSSIISTFYNAASVCCLVFFFVLSFLLVFPHCFIPFTFFCQIFHVHSFINYIYSFAKSFFSPPFASHFLSLPLCMSEWEGVAWVVCFV